MESARCYFSSHARMGHYANIEVINHMRELGLERIEALADAEYAWGEDLRKFALTAIQFSSAVER